MHAPRQVTSGFLLRSIRSLVIFVLLFCVVLFLPAGNFAWIGGWVFTGNKADAFLRQAPRMLFRYDVFLSPAS